MSNKKAGTEGNHLTGLELISGGDNPIKRVVLKDITKDDEPGVVFVKPLSTRQGLSAAGSKDKTLHGHMVKVVANNTVSEDGVKLFTEMDAARLQDMSMSVFTTLFTAISGSDEDEDKTTEEAEDEGND